MKVSEKFASNFLKAEDLQGRKVHVVIASIGEEQIGDENHARGLFPRQAESAGPEQDQRQLSRRGHLRRDRRLAGRRDRALSDQGQLPGQDGRRHPGRDAAVGRRTEAAASQPQPNAYAAASQPSQANAGPPAAQPRRQPSACSTMRSLSERDRGRSASATTAPRIGRR